MNVVPHFSFFREVKIVYHPERLRQCINVNARNRLKNDDIKRQRAQMAALPEPTSPHRSFQSPPPQPAPCSECSTYADPHRRPTCTVMEAREYAASTDAKWGSIYPSTPHYQLSPSDFWLCSMRRWHVEAALGNQC